MDDDPKWDDALNITQRPGGALVPFDAARLLSPVHLNAVALGLPSSDKHQEKHPRLAITVRRLAIAPPGSAAQPPANAALGWSCRNAPRAVHPSPDGSPIAIADLSVPPPARIGGEWKKATFTASADGLRIAAPKGHGWLDINLQTLDLTPVADRRIRLRVTLSAANTHRASFACVVMTS